MSPDAQNPGLITVIVGLFVSFLDEQNKKDSYSSSCQSFLRKFSDEFFCWSTMTRSLNKKHVLYSMSSFGVIASYTGKFKRWFCSQSCHYQDPLKHTLHIHYQPGIATFSCPPQRSVGKNFPTAARCFQFSILGHLNLDKDGSCHAWVVSGAVWCAVGMSGWVRDRFTIVRISWFFITY